MPNAADSGLAAIGTSRIEVGRSPGDSLGGDRQVPSQRPRQSRTWRSGRYRVEVDHGAAGAEVAHRHVAHAAFLARALVHVPAEHESGMLPLDRAQHCCAAESAVDVPLRGAGR